MSFFILTLTRPVCGAGDLPTNILDITTQSVSSSHLLQNFLYQLNIFTPHSKLFYHQLGVVPTNILDIPTQSVSSLPFSLHDARTLAKENT